MDVVRWRTCVQFHSWYYCRDQGERYPSSLGVHCLADPRNRHRTLCEYAQVRVSDPTD